jgi:alkylation response protein AidB-like acyl-CoA dehydrogenase
MPFQQEHPSKAIESTYALASSWEAGSGMALLSGIATLPNLANLLERSRKSRLHRRTIADFPSELLRDLALWEQETDVLNAQPLGYYVALASSCLTTAFIMTQRHAAMRRLETSSNPRAHDVWLPRIRSGEAFATVGISHLTTSRRHLSVPPVRVQWDGQRGRLEGSIPWVTGAPHAKYIVAGAVEASATIPSDPDSAGVNASSTPHQYLIMLELPAQGVRPGPGMELIALTSSCTDVVDLNGVVINKEHVLHGPHDNVMAASNTGGAGGLQTSALALGLSAAAIEYLANESQHRPAIADHARVLRSQWEDLIACLIADQPNLDANQLRKRANDLALDATHAALAAAKGAGFVAGHPVGGWCQEALFFLVWSCPQIVADAHMCSFSGWQT